MKHGLSRGPLGLRVILVQFLSLILVGAGLLGVVLVLTTLTLHQEEDGYEDHDEGHQHTDDDRDQDRVAAGVAVAQHYLELK